MIYLMQCTITASYLLLLFWPSWQCLENKRGFFPIEWPKNWWLEFWGPSISVPLVLQSSSARTVTVSALNQYSLHFAIKILWYTCMQQETIDNSRFSCTSDVHIIWYLIISTGTKLFNENTGRILRQYKLHWWRQMSIWSKEAYTMFYKRLNERGREINFSVRNHDD